MGHKAPRGYMSRRASRSEMPGWDRLYRTASERDLRRERQRLEKQHEEDQWLQKVSVHSAVENDERFQQLYQDYDERGHRAAMRRAKAEEEQAEHLAKASVHRNLSGNSGAAGNDRSNILYLDGLLRLDRLEAKRDEMLADWEASPQEPVYSNGARFDALYEDAYRRAEHMRLRRQLHEEEELAQYRRPPPSRVRWPLPPARGVSGQQAVMLGDTAPMAALLIHGADHALGPLQMSQQPLQLGLPQEPTVRIEACPPRKA